MVMDSARSSTTGSEERVSLVPNGHHQPPLEPVSPKQEGELAAPTVEDRPDPAVGCMGCWAAIGDFTRNQTSLYAALLVSQHHACRE
jgi:hypothetical protein